MWVKDKTKITDCQNGFRAIKGNIAKQLNLKEDGFAIEQEMVIKCLEKGYRIREIPSYELKRQYGNSRIKPIMICRYIWCLTKNAIKYHV